MALNPTTLESAAAVRDYLEKTPGGDAEKRLVAQTIHTVTREVPIDRHILGETLIQHARLINALIDNIRKADPLLDWESSIAVALNVLTIAGYELYTCEKETRT